MSSTTLDGAVAYHSSTSSGLASRAKPRHSFSTASTSGEDGADLESFRT